MTILEALIVSEIALTEQMTAEVDKGEKAYDGFKFATLQNALETVHKFRKEVQTAN